MPTLTLTLAEAGPASASNQKAAIPKRIGFLKSFTFMVLFLFLQRLANALPGRLFASE